MSRSTMAVVSIVACLGLPACTQTQTSTQAADDPPASCGETIKAAWDNIFLRIQHDVGNTSRESSKAHLYAAEQAAQAGNEQECWRQYNWAKYLVR
ncbi:MAG: hypothetical protein JO128_17545 [Alphaproteobacteria bacterium]|nr:hypothetical protein [Alphaproteobacteria bacterium]